MAERCLSVMAMGGSAVCYRMRGHIGEHRDQVACLLAAEAERDARGVELTAANDRAERYKAVLEGFPFAAKVTGLARSVVHKGDYDSVSQAELVGGVLGWLEQNAAVLNPIPTSDTGENDG